MSNPNIGDVGVRFAQGDGRKRGAEAAWSVRGAVRRLAALDVDLNDEAEVKKALGGMITNAQRVALVQLRKAFKEDADTRTAEFIDERIDGKLPQANINAELQAIQGMNGEQLEDLIRELTNKTTVGYGSAGAAEAPGTSSAAGAEVQPVSEQPA